MKQPYFAVSSQELSLPNKAAYYLTDPEGTLLYHLSTRDYTKEEFQALVDGYTDESNCNAESHVLKDVTASDGMVRNVFFYHMENGCTGILTIPRDEILSGADVFRNVSIVLVAFALLLTILQILRTRKEAQREAEYQIYQKAMSSTVHACRAIYYIDLKTKACDIVYPLGADGKPMHSTYDKEVQDRFKYGVVAEEHADLVADFPDLSNIEKRLADREHIELQFKRWTTFDVANKSLASGEYEWCSIAVTVAEEKNGTLTAITMAIRSIDDVIQREEDQKEMLSLAVARAEAASRARATSSPG